MVAAERIEELYRRHVPEAVRLATLLTGDAAAAQDVAHDAFMAVATRSRSIRDPEKFGAYLRTTVVRQVLMRHRSSTRELARAERAARGVPVTTAGAHAGTGDRLVLVEALRTLPDRQRAALVLRYWHDLSEHEIARTLGCRPGTVKSLLSRGLAALKEVVPSDV